MSIKFNALSFVVIILVAGLMTSGFAKITGVINFNTPTTTIGGGADNSYSAGVTQSDVVPTQGITCSDDNYMPLSLLNTLMGGNKLKVEPVFVDGKIKLNLTVDAMITDCLQLNFEVSQKGNNLFISARNIKEYDSDISGNSMIEKYESCLKSKDIINESGQIDASNITPRKVVASIPPQFEFDDTKTVKLVYGSPDTLGRMYGALHNWINLSTEQSPNPCLKYEDVEEGGLYAYDQEAVNETRALKVCNDNYIALAEELNRTNLDRLSQTNEILLKSLTSKLDKLLADDMTEMAESITQAKHCETERDDLDVSSDEYHNLMSYLKRYNIEPKVKRLKELAAQRNKRKGKKERNQEIKDIKAELKKVDDAISSDVIKRLQEFSLGTKAMDIAKVKFMARAYYKHPLNHKTAEKKLKNSLKSVVEYGKAVGLEYRARHGDRAGLNKIEKKIKKLVKRMQERQQKYQQKEQAYTKACSGGLLFGDSALCEEANGAQGMQKRRQAFERQRKKDSKKLKKYADLHKRLKRLAQTGGCKDQDEEFASEDGDLFDEDDGFSTSSSDQTFSNSGQDAFSRGTTTFAPMNGANPFAGQQQMMGQQQMGMMPGMSGNFGYPMMQGYSNHGTMGQIPYNFGYQGYMGGMYPNLQMGMQPYYNQFGRQPAGYGVMAPNMMGRGMQQPMMMSPWMSTTGANPYGP